MYVLVDIQLQARALDGKLHYRLHMLHMHVVKYAFVQQPQLLFVKDGEQLLVGDKLMD